MQTPQDPEDTQDPGDFSPPKGFSKNPFEKMKNLLGNITEGFGKSKTPKKEIGIEPPSGSPSSSDPLKKSAQNKLFQVPLRLFAAADKMLENLIGKLPSSIGSGLQTHRTKILTVLLILIFVFGAKHFFFAGKGAAKVSLEEVMKQKEQKPADAIISVKGFKIGRFNFEDSLNALGTIKGAMEFKLSFEVPGTISSINYREGERYEEGALLISLKQDDILLRLKRAQAEYNKTQAQAQIAQQKVEENEKLFAMGAVPKTTLENVKLEHESSKFESEANRLEMKANEAMLEKSNLYAPSAGMIGELNIEEGETVTQNTLLGTHIMTEYVYAEFGVVERDVNKIALGQKARVFVDAYPDKTFDGVIENVAPIVAGTSRTATAKVRIENPDRLLLPGMFARIRILLYSKKNTLVVPTDAVQGKAGEQFVYVVHSGKGPLIKQSEKKIAAGGPDGAAIPLPGSAGEKPETEQPQLQPEDNDKGAPGGSSEKAAQGKVLPQETKKSSKKNKDKKSGVVEAVQEPEKKEEDLTVKKRPITVGYTRPDYTQIDAGLSEGEVIAVSGLERLEDNKKVRLLETQEAEI